MRSSWAFVPFGLASQNSLAIITFEVPRHCSGSVHDNISYTIL